MAKAILKTAFQTEMTFSDNSKLIISKEKDGEAILQVISGDGKLAVTAEDMLALQNFADVGVKLIQRETKG